MAPSRHLRTVVAVVWCGASCELNRVPGNVSAIVLNQLINTVQLATDVWQMPKKGWHVRTERAQPQS